MKGEKKFKDALKWQTVSWKLNKEAKQESQRFNHTNYQTLVTNAKHIGLLAAFISSQ